MAEGWLPTDQRAGMAIGIEPEAGTVCVWGVKWVVNSLRDGLQYIWRIKPAGGGETPFGRGLAANRSEGR